MFLVGRNPDGILSHPVLYRGGPLILGQAEEGPLHEVLLVTSWEIAGEGNE